MHATNVVEFAVVGFADHCVHRTNRFIAGMMQRVANKCLESNRHAQRIDQRDRRLDVTKLIDLRRADQLPKALPR